MADTKILSTVGVVMQEFGGIATSVARIHFGLHIPDRGRARFKASFNNILNEGGLLEHLEGTLSSFSFLRNAVAYAELPVAIYNDRKDGYVNMNVAVMSLVIRSEFLETIRKKCNGHHDDRQESIITLTPGLRICDSLH